MEMPRVGARGAHALDMGGGVGILGIWIRRATPTGSVKTFKSLHHPCTGITEFI